jgi:hypothetical protein
MAVHPDDVWDRACRALAAPETVELREGDVALMRVIDLDGSIQRNGLLATVQDHETAAGVDALRWFGLTDLADLVLETGQAAARTPERDLGRLEVRADAAYRADEVEERLQRALAERIRTSPAAFGRLVP